MYILSVTGGCGVQRVGGLKTEICTCTDLMRLEPSPGYQRTLPSSENVNLIEKMYTLSQTVISYNCRNSNKL